MLFIDFSRFVCFCYTRFSSRAPIRFRLISLTDGHSRRFNTLNQLKSCRQDLTSANAHRRPATGRQPGVSRPLYITAPQTCPKCRLRFKNNHIVCTVDINGRYSTFHQCWDLTIKSLHGSLKSLIMKSSNRKYHVCMPTLSHSHFLLTSAAFCPCDALFTCF